jgi:DNA-binding transcriptional LysR family regulator
MMTVEFEDMRLFVRAMHWGSLSAAGRELGFSPAVASKRLSRLERALGVRLLQRSSRRLALTDAGGRYLERARHILADIDDAAADAARDGTVSGRLRVAAPNALGRRWIGPALARFCDAYPAVDASLSLSDGVVDLLEGGFDLAVRIGAATDSALVSRRLAANRRVLCAAPCYLARHGVPTRVEDLSRHDCLVQLRPGMLPQEWRFRVADGVRAVRVSGRLSSDNGEQILDWALQGRGLALKSVWDVAADVAAGRLVTVLDAVEPDLADLHLVFPSRRHLPAHTRLFIEALVQCFDSAGGAPGGLDD